MPKIVEDFPEIRRLMRGDDWWEPRKREEEPVALAVPRTEPCILPDEVKVQLLMGGWFLCGKEESFASPAPPEEHNLDELTAEIYQDLKGMVDSIKEEPDPATVCKLKPVELTDEMVARLANVTGWVCDEREIRFLDRKGECVWVCGCVTLKG